MPAASAAGVEGEAYSRIFSASSGLHPRSTSSIARCRSTSGLCGELVGGDNVVTDLLECLGAPALDPLAFGFDWV